MSIMTTVSVVEVIPVRVRPLRLRSFVVVTPIKVPGGYNNEFFDFYHYETLRPFRTYRDRIKHLFNTFRFESARFDAGAWFFFDLPPGEEPAPLPEGLARLKHVADEFRRILEGA